MIDIDNVTIHVGSFRLDDVSLYVPAGKYAVLMGKTGCGKTTVLESIIGLRRVVSGRISLGGVDVTRMKPALRGVGFMPQDGALFSTMTVRENLAFALTIRKRPRVEIARRVDELSEDLGIRDLLDRRPQGLSGGEAQRVALGRALAFRPSVLCLDEPLSSLDEDTSAEMRDLLKRMQKSAGITTLHITHNRSEATELADKLLRLEDGRVQEVNDFPRNAPAAEDHAE